MESDIGDGSTCVVGVKQLTKALKQGMVKVVYLAKDADAHVLDPIRAMIGNDVPVIEAESMEKLGKACGIQVGAAAAGVLNKSATGIEI